MLPWAVALEPAALFDRGGLVGHKHSVYHFVVVGVVWKLMLVKGEGRLGKKTKNSCKKFFHVRAKTFQKKKKKKK
jgi:hypothetical protein